MVCGVISDYRIKSELMRKLTYHNYVNNPTSHYLLDKQSPIISKSININPFEPWMSPDIINAKVRRRYLDRMWTKSRMQLNRSMYAKQCHIYKRHMTKAKSDLYRNMIFNNFDNPRQYQNRKNRTFHRKVSVFLPAIDSNNSLSNLFSIHFKDKDKINQTDTSFPGRASSCNIDFPVVHHPFTVFTVVPLTENAKINLPSLNRSFEYDPIVTFLLKTLSSHTNCSNY